MPVPRPIRILIVDDDKKLNRTLEFQLGKAGFMTKSVFDGEAALAVLEKEKFDLIILDLVMPKMPGFDVLRAIRGRGIGVPVIVLSALRQEEDVKRAKELGASDYFSKSAAFIDDIVKYAEKVSVS